MLAQRDFLLIGHRGAAGLAPENTLASFAKAVALGVDGVELDVHFAAGELVVIHDEQLARTTNGSGRVGELSFRQLRRLDAGAGERIPILAEVLEAVPPSVLVNVELKGVGTALPVAQMLRGQRRPLLVSSFDYDELLRFHAACADVPCAPLVRRWPAGLEAVAKSLGAGAVNLADRAVTAARLAELASWGCRALVFTVNDAKRARALKALGVGGVFTDYPDRLAGVSKRSNSRSSR